MSGIFSLQSVYFGCLGFRTVDFYRLWTFPSGFLLFFLQVLKCSDHFKFSFFYFHKYIFLASQKCDFLFFTFKMKQDIMSDHFINCRITFIQDLVCFKLHKSALTWDLLSNLCSLGANCIVLGLRRFTNTDLHIFHQIITWNQQPVEILLIFFPEIFVSLLFLFKAGLSLSFCLLAIKLIKYFH